MSSILNHVSCVLSQDLQGGPNLQARLRLRPHRPNEDQRFASPQGHQNTREGGVREILLRTASITQTAGTNDTPSISTASSSQSFTRAARSSTREQPLPSKYVSTLEFLSCVSKLVCRTQCKRWITWTRGI